MKEAWSSADQAILRTRPQGARWYLLVHKPASVFRARIANTPTTWPASAVNVDNTAGTIGDVLAGYTAVLGTSDNASGLGEIRIRRDASGSTLQVAEAGCALLDIREGNYITVYKQIKPWTKHYRKEDPDDPDNHNFIIDYDETYTSQLEQYGPLVIMGPPEVVMIGTSGTDSSPLVYETSMVGTSTQLLGGSFATASWTMPIGEIANQSSKLGTPQDPVVYQLDGTESLVDGDYFTLTVTDASGASHKGYRPIWALHNASQAKRVEVGRIEGGIEDGGYEAQIRAWGNSEDLSTDAFPDGAEIIIFEQASFGDTASSIGGNYPFRSHIVFRGWIVEDTVAVNPFHSEATFRARTIDGLLSEAEAYDTFLADYKDGTSAWSEASELTIDRMAWYMVRHRSNVGDIVDVSLGSNLSTCRITYQDLGRGKFWDQLRTNYGEKGHKGYVAADLQSNIFAFEDTQITGGSNNIPLVYNIGKQDRRDQLLISHPVKNRAAQTIMLSVASTTAGTSNLLPVGAESPGSVIGYFGGRTEHSKGLFVDQDTLVQWSGNWRAKLNNPFPQTLAPLAGNFRLDSVPLARVTLPMAASDNARGITWRDENDTLPSGASVDYFLPKRTGLTYSGQTGTVLTDVELEKVTHGIGGSSITFPQVETVETEDPPEPIDPPEEEQNTGGDGLGAAYAMTGDTLARTSDLSATSPAWTDIGPSTTDDLSYFILDPWSPSTGGYLVTRGGSVFKSTDLDQASPSWTEVLDSSTINSRVNGNIGGSGIRMIRGSINQQDYIAINFTTNESGVGNYIYCGVSTNGGGSWSFYQVDFGAEGSSLGANGAFDIVPYTIGGSLVLYMVSEDANEDIHIYKSTDSGQSWSTITTINGSGVGNEPAPLATPYNNNADGNYLITHASVDTISPDGIIESTDGGENWSTLYNTGFDENDVALRTAIHVYTQDRDIITLCFDDGRIAQTTDGSSFSVISSAANTPDTTAHAFGGFPYNSQQFYLLTDAGIYITTDNGSSWTDKTGDWSFGFTFPGGQGGHGVIVPNWTE